MTMSFIIVLNTTPSSSLWTFCLLVNVFNILTFIDISLLSLNFAIRLSEPLASPDPTPHVTLFQSHFSSDTLAETSATHLLAECQTPIPPASIPHCFPDYRQAKRIQPPHPSMTV